MKKIEDALQSARRRAGMTRADVALRLRITPEQLTRWETGEERPGTEALFDLSTLYRIPPHRLLIEDDETAAPVTPPPDDAAPALDAFRRELVAMREVELLPLDDETIDYCVAAMRARLIAERSQNK